MTVQCQKCKAENWDEATVCHVCGADLSASKKTALKKQPRKALIAQSPFSRFLAKPPFRVKPGKPGFFQKSTMGLVTHLRTWFPPGVGQNSKYQNWLFDLRLTDEQGCFLKDKNGFEEPAIEVEYLTNAVHGTALEEGCPVVVTGGWHGKRFSAKEVWNCSSTDDSMMSEYWGQAISVQIENVPDLRYPDQRQLKSLSFQLLQTDHKFQPLRDPTGNLLPGVSVVIRAQDITAYPKEKDQLQIVGQLVKGILYTKNVKNWSAGGAEVIIKEWAGIQ